MPELSATPSTHYCISLFFKQGDTMLNNNHFRMYYIVDRPVCIFDRKGYQMTRAYVIQNETATIPTVREQSCQSPDYNKY